jgi:hypothetical protein
MTNGNDSFHPFKERKVFGGVAYYSDNTGLTKREYFAAMAMQGICANLRSIYNVPEQEGFKLVAMVAEDAVTQADALIKALNETGE